MTGEWYFERWKRDGEAAHISDTTKDFSRVLHEAASANAFDEIFRGCGRRSVRPTRSCNSSRHWGSSSGSKGLKPYL
jgi:hypothetical protein